MENNSFWVVVTVVQFYAAWIAFEYALDYWRRQSH